MGSYLSINNDTEHTWCVKIGPNEAALKVVLFTTNVVATIAALIATTGAAASVLSSLSADGVVVLFGVGTEWMAAVCTAVAQATGVSAPAATAAGVASSVSMYMTKIMMQNHGMVRLEPGQKMKWGKMPVSLCQQGTCFRSVSIGNEIHTYVLYMRPIFSGPTENSENEHSINWWLQKCGTEKHTAVIAGSTELEKINRLSPAIATASARAVAEADNGVTTIENVSETTGVQDMQ